MLLPHVELNVPAEDPDQVRSLLSRLSRISSIGVVEALLTEDYRIIRAYADRFSYSIVGTANETAIFEHFGPKVVRVWRKDPPALAEDLSNPLQNNFGEHESGLEKFTYLYTEESWFIWRAHHETFLPRLKRRAFLTALDQIAVLHSRQKDIPGGESIEYVLELEGRIWKRVIALLVADSGEREVLAEETQAVEFVGF